MVAQKLVSGRLLLNFIFYMKIRCEVLQPLWECDIALAQLLRNELRFDLFLEEFVWIYFQYLLCFSTRLKEVIGAMENVRIQLAPLQPEFDHGRLTIIQEKESLMQELLNWHRDLIYEKSKTEKASLDEVEDRIYRLREEITINKQRCNFVSNRRSVCSSKLVVFYFINSWPFQKDIWNICFQLEYFVATFDLF